MRLIEFASDAQAQLDLLRKIYDCTFSAIAAQGKAKAEQAATKNHNATTRPKIKPNQFVKKLAGTIKPIKPIVPMPAVPQVQAEPQPRPILQKARLPNSLKPLSTSVLSPINNKLSTPNDLAKNQSAP